MSAENRRKSDKRSRIIDILIIALFLSGALFFVNLFHLDLRRTLTSRDQEPVGTIIIKNNIVQRRLADRVVWDRLFADSPVYSGDLIRVASLSTANLNIESASIDLNENTLIRIVRSPDSDGEFRIELSTGNLSLDSGKGNSFTLDLMGREVQAGPGTVLNANAADDGVALQVFEGRASVINGRQRSNITSGSMLSLDARGAQRTVPAAVVTQPLPNARYLNSGHEPLVVNFAWRRENIGASAALRLELAADRNFSRIIHTIETSASAAQAALEAGSWHWRLILGNETLSSGHFTVTDGSGIELLSPAMNSVVLYNRNAPELSFQWSEMEDALSYVLEVSAAPDFRNTRINTQTTANSLSDSSLGAGTWYWRVRPVFASSYGTGAVYSPAASFRIEQGAANEVVVAPRRESEAEPAAVAAEPPTPAPQPAPTTAQRPAPAPAPATTQAPAAIPAQEPVSPPLLAAPENLFPPDGYRVGIEHLRSTRSLTFRWSPVTGANAYVFTLYRQTSGGRQQINRIGPQSSAAWTLDNIAVLGRGAYVWQVEAVSRNQAGVIELWGTAGENTFVLDVPPPRVPQVVDTGRLYGE